MGDELIDVVDEKDRIIGKETRREAHSNGALHRGVHVILFNGRGEMLLQVRSPSKKHEPNSYDLSVSEHVKSGESFDAAAKRGLKEELGIRDAGPARMLKFRMNYGENDNMISVLYSLQHPGGGIRYDKKEISGVEFHTLSEVRRMVTKKLSGRKFAGFGLQILRWYFGAGSSVQEIEVFMRPEGRRTCAPLCKA